FHVTGVHTCALPIFALPLRVLRDIVSSGVDKVSVDHPETFERMREFARTFMPDHTGRIELYRSERPIFDLYGVEDEIQRSLDRKDRKTTRLNSSHVK